MTTTELNSNDNDGDDDDDGGEDEDDEEGDDGDDAPDDRDGQDEPFEHDNTSTKADNDNDNTSNNDNDIDNDNDNAANRNEGPTTTSRHDLLSAAMKKATALLHECGGSRQKTASVLERARELAGKAGLSVESFIVNPNHPAKASSAFGVPEDFITNATEGGSNGNSTTDAGARVAIRGPVPPCTNHHHNSTLPPMMRVVDNVHHTGAYSNTDHYVQRTGDRRADRIAELKRHLLRRHRAMRPEDRGEERWDKPKLPGERRRRIVREKDLDIAPPEPPATGWIAFLFQMTHKIRHDRPKCQHDQSKSE
jgi:hypothetical protein